MLPNCSFFRYDELSRTRDLQMLAMLAVLILQIHVVKPKPPDPSIYLSAATPQSGPMDYFNFMTSAYPLASATSPTSPTWPRLPSPTALPLATSMSSNSSRGSWSSLFNAGSMRQFVTGVQDTLKDGLNAPADHPATSHAEAREANSPGLKRNSARKGSPLYPTPTMSKSWGDTISNPSKLASVSFFSPGHRRPSALRIVDPQVFVQEKKRVVFRPPSPPERFVPFLLHILDLRLHL